MLMLYHCFLTSSTEWRCSRHGQRPWLRTCGWNFGGNDEESTRERHVLLKRVFYRNSKISHMNVWNWTMYSRSSSVFHVMPVYHGIWWDQVMCETLHNCVETLYVVLCHAELVQHMVRCFNHASNYLMINSEQNSAFMRSCECACTHDECSLFSLTLLNSLSVPVCRKKWKLCALNSQFVLC